MRRTKADWIAIIDEFERSGESHLEFAGRRRLLVSSFRAWLYRLRRERRSGKVARSATPRMLPVRVRAEARADDLVEVVVQGAVVRVRVGTDVRYVAELAAALARC